MNIKYTDEELVKYGKNVLLMMGGVIPINEHIGYYKKKMYSIEGIAVPDSDTRLFIFKEVDLACPSKGVIDKLKKSILVGLLSNHIIVVDRHRMNMSDVTMLTPRQLTISDVDMVPHFKNGYMWDNEDDVLYVFRDAYIKSKIALAEVLTHSRGKWVKKFRERGGYIISKRLPSWLCN